MKKSVIKQLKQSARDLVEALKTSTKKIKGSDLIKKDPNAVDLNGGPINPDKFYMVKELKQVDHFPFMKKLYSNGGAAAVLKYVREVHADYVKNVLEQ